MNCEKTRETLRRRFDEGLALTDGLERHLATCTACRAYLVRLEALDGTLARLPLDVPPVGLAACVQARVDATDNPSRARLWAAAVALALVGIAGGLGWFFPVAVEVPVWLAKVGPWIPRVNWPEAGRLLAAPLRASWHEVAAWLSLSPDLSPAALWMGLGVTVLFLAGLNWSQVVRQGAAANGDAANMANGRARAGKRTQ